MSSLGNSATLWEIEQREFAMRYEERLLRRQEVEVKTGLTRSTIYRLMRAGEFPEPLKLGPRAVRWRATEIESWIAERPRATGETKPVA